MANRPALVTETEVKRAVKGALAGGLRIGRVDVDPVTGRVSIYPEGGDPDASPNPCDRLLK